MKKRKETYYDKYFERNWNNNKNTWKVIKSLLSVINVLSFDNGDTMILLTPLVLLLTPLVLHSNTYDMIPYDIANTFNNYFASIDET